MSIRFQLLALVILFALGANAKVKSGQKQIAKTPESHALFFYCPDEKQGFHVAYNSGKEEIGRAHV